MNFTVDSEKLMLLLKNFYTLTKIRIVVFDNSLTEIASYPNHHSTYCNILRKSDKALKKCSLCDKESCKKSQNTQKTVIYRCYAGLVEAVTPIRCDGITVGYIMFGQVLQTNDYDSSWNEIEPVLKGFDVDINELKRAYYKKTNLTTDVITAASEVLQACSGYLYLSKMISLSKASIESRLDAYINEHLSDDLSVMRLCDEFNISKTRLYEISEYSYSRPISEHIRILRVKKAKELLKSTNKKISEIALMCGIDDYNYFTKIFKRYTNLTPMQFKKGLNITL